MSPCTCTEVSEERLFCLCSIVKLHVAQNFTHAELLTLDHSRYNNSITEPAIVLKFSRWLHPLLMQPTRYVTKFWQTIPDGRFSLRRSHMLLHTIMGSFPSVRVSRDSLEIMAIPGLSQDAHSPGSSVRVSRDSLVTVTLPL